ncbi:MAG TPA: glutamate synthase [Rhodospirillaceae bacterium]|nr:glutamate synthase [Rhodospirillaceae bacterium]
MNMKPFATVLEVGSSLSNRTGSWRTERPVYVHRLPPCNNACPAGENIQEWLSLVEQEKYEDAWREIVKNNPFPAIMGRVCYHPCENACNRVVLESPVGINSVEQFLGDKAIKEGWAFDKPAKASGKKVLVIGSGPAGLSAAYQLARAGHKVTIKEMLDKTGGMLRFGIPQYRLPRDVLDAEIKRILDLGVELQLNTKESDLAATMEKGGFDAVFLSAGAHIAKLASFPTSDNARVLDAVSVLRDMEGKTKPSLGKRVVVYGGGNTALDVARTAKRLGAETVTIVYRRNREKMPAHAFEVDEALQENIVIKYLSTIKDYQKTTLTLETMALDEKGWPQPTGKTETMEADCVVLALGQDSDLSFLDKVSGLKIANGVLEVDAQMMSGHPGLFAGGDMVPSSRTATVGIGHGKKAARHIDLWLFKQEAPAEVKNEIAGSDRLNTWYYAEAQRTERKMTDGAKRAGTFDEVQSGLSQDEALSEARRCLSCGNCFECDNCYGVCPDNAIKKLGAGKGFEINLDYCKGCALCATECPCGSIDMVPEEN